MGRKSSMNESLKNRKWICCCIIFTPWLILGVLLQMFFARHFNHQIHPRSSSITSSSSSITSSSSSSSNLDNTRSIFLAAVIFNRVFQADKFNITAQECKEWIDYMLFAGVNHIFWYDTAHQDSESQQESFRPYTDSGLMSYHRFYSLFPAVVGADFHYEQDNSYTHFLQNYNQSVSWAVEMDVDEYPFGIADSKPGFLSRFVQRIERESPLVSQILLQCMMFLGNPIGEGWVIERYQRRKGQTEGEAPGFRSRQKPIFKPAMCEGVTSFDPHKFSMVNGSTFVAPSGEMRMNHYWGPRLTDFGPDTPEAVDGLVEDRSIRPIVTQLKNKLTKQSADS